MFPLLALGLLGMAGGAWGQQKYLDIRESDRAKRLAEGITPLLGQAPQPMGPEGPQGQMGLTGGSGLLADPTDITRQMQFAQGLMGLPGGARALQTYEPIIGRALQSKQWTQQQETQAKQYGQTEARLTDQFEKNYGLSQDQAAEMAKQHLAQQEQWTKSFEAQRADAANQQRLAQARLGIDYKQLALSEATAATAARQAGVPKLPMGYGLVDSASGIVAAPYQGTKEFAEAKDGESALVSATADIDKFMDIFAGKEKVGSDGKTRRVGGTGTELIGEKSGTLGQLYSNILSSIGKLHNLGVLNVGDVDRMTKTLPDPSTFSSSWRANKTMQASYDELRREFDEKLGSYRKSNPWLVPPPPPGFVPHTGK